MYIKTEILQLIPYAVILSLIGRHGGKAELLLVSLNSVLM
jgi:hypothetical protein